MPSLILNESAIAGPNTGSHTLVSATLDYKPVLVSAAGHRIDLIDENCNLVQSIHFKAAFSGLEDDAKVEAVAVDGSEGRVAAVLNSRVAIWSPRGSGWRVHSSFKVPHKVVALDFVRGKIVAAGDGLSLWELEETGGFPVWNRVGSLSLPQPVSLACLSPSASVLATVTLGSSTVLFYSILPKSAPSSSKSENRLQFRSRASHSVRIRSISWRPSDDAADSGPVLFTQTLEGIFRIWGTMIDEPSFFSLWASLDVHSTLPKHLPLATLYWKTKPMVERKEGTGGTEDHFVTLFGEGSVALTIVQNLDSRPPTCLTQCTKLLQEAVFSTPAQLASLRYPFLLRSRSSPNTSFHLIGRSSRSVLVHTRASLPLDFEHANSSPFKKVFRDPPTLPPVSVVGRVRRLTSTLKGYATVALGDRRLQVWEVVEDEGVVAQNWVGEVREEWLEGDVGVATWHGGRYIALASLDTLRILFFQPRTNRLQLIVSSPIHTSDLHGEPIFSSPLAFFAAKTSEDAPSTTLVYVSRSGVVRSFVYHAPSKRLENVPTPMDDLGMPLPEGVKLRLVEPLPPSPPRAEAQDSTRDEMGLLAVDEEGTLYRWRASLGKLEEEGWVCEDEGKGKAKGKGKKGVRTNLRGNEKVAVAHDGTSAIVARDDDGRWMLSIWDPRASEFSSGKQFEREIQDAAVALLWSSTSSVLALATGSSVELLCAQKLDDLSGSESWKTVATISVADILPSPITALSWLSSGGLCLAASDHLFFYSPTLSSASDVTTNIHQLAERATAPLPLHHPQLLFQAILQGHYDAVLQILSNLAAELTEEGQLTPLPTMDEDGRTRKEKLTLDAFLKVPGVFEKKVNVSREEEEGRGDVFTALTTSTSASRSRDSSHRTLSEESVSRLLAAIRQQSLAGLSKLEHEHLAVLAQTVFETQARRSALDDNGLRFLVSLRSFYLYRSSSPTVPKMPPATLNGPTVSERLKYRDMLWAFHSESQDLLLEEATKACGGKLDWERARTLGLGIWVKSFDTLVRTMETIGRTSFAPPNGGDRDPITASLFYLALKKLHIVQTFWKQSSGHADQRQMIKFLANDFEEQRWVSAARKNAFALLSKQRFLFAAAFFLLGASLKDAVSVILRHLDDFQLAIAIAKTYEGNDQGPVLRFVLEEHVIPLAFRKGYRWLASWAFWVLKRRDWAVQVVVTPLADLASRLPYQLGNVSSPQREDPALVLLFAQLRSWSLQTVKGAIAVPAKTEFNFVLHISRILCRMGCHVLALNLLRSWHFLPPAPSATSRPRPNPLANRRQSLLLSSTKLDLPLPPSALPSRVGSPAPSSGAEEDKGEKERQKQQFREVVKQVKVEAKAPAEFSFDAFGF
ncbi:hypothetical protein JCM11641_001385 [Rhodosporidiobolus odoratus]